LLTLDVSLVAKSWHTIKAILTASVEETALIRIQNCSMVARTTINGNSYKSTSGKLQSTNYVLQVQIDPNVIYSRIFLIRHLKGIRIK